MLNKGLKRHLLKTQIKHLGKKKNKTTSKMKNVLNEIIGKLDIREEKINEIEDVKIKTI